MNNPAFDESGLVESVDFQFPEESDPAAEDERRIRQEIALNLLRLLCVKNANRTQVGTRALLLLYLLGKGDIPNRKTLAKRLGISLPRVSQTLTRLKRELPMFTGLS